MALWGHFPTPCRTPRPVGVTFEWSRSGSHLPTGEEGQCVISNHLSGLQRNWGDWTCGSSRHVWHRRLPHVDWLPQSSAVLTATLTCVDRCDCRCLTFQETCLLGRDGESVSVGKGSGDSKGRAKHGKKTFFLHKRGLWNLGDFPQGNRIMVTPTSKDVKRPMTM